MLRMRPNRAANMLMNDLGIRRKAPIDVNEVVARLSQIKHMVVQIHEEKFANSLNGISAILVKEKNKAIIAVNSIDSESRKRFSISHELGHLLLHGNHEGLKVEKGIQPQLFNKVVYTRADAVHDKAEREANEFAAELLMPEDLIKTDFEKALKDNDDNLISVLAKKYKVSEIAMQYRLNNLHLVEFVD